MWFIWIEKQEWDWVITGIGIGVLEEGQQSLCSAAMYLMIVFAMGNDGNGIECQKSVVAAADGFGKRKKRWYIRIGSRQTYRTVYKSAHQQLAQKAIPPRNSLFLVQQIFGQTLHEYK